MRVVVIGVTAVVLSLSYMTFVTLTPASQRPYVDGSTTDSIYQQVFTTTASPGSAKPRPNRCSARTLGTPIFSQAEPPPGGTGW